MSTKTLTDSRYADAFGQYLRRGFGDHLTGEHRTALTEARAQGVGAGSAGGFLVPQEFWEHITETLKAYGGLLSAANLVTTGSGAPLPWPANDDTANPAVLLSENTQPAETDEIFTSKTLNAYTYTAGRVLASIQLTEDTAFDLDTWLAGRFGVRLSRGVAPDLIGGNGTGRPTGILTNVRTGITGGTGSTTAALWSATAYGKAYNDLVNLSRTVDAAYRQGGNCSWLMHDLTLAAILEITDGQNRPIFDPARGGITDAGTISILGYPVVIDNAMPVMAANAKAIVFGDLKAGYAVRQVAQGTVTRLDERFADSLQVGWIGFGRFDGMIDDNAAVACFVNSAT
jgi:HK97 family phage major capsid protein